MRHVTRLLVIAALGITLFHGSAMAQAEDDYLGYPVDSEVKIYINWASFEAQGISASWKGPFTDAVINAYTRWSQVAGMRLKPKFWDYTDATTVNAGELLIMMNEKHATSTRLASRFGNPAMIVFHRKSGATDTPWNFTPYRAAAGEFDMQGILMHEMGHAFGLEHESDARSLMVGNYTWEYRYGPQMDDIGDIRRQYGARTDLRVHIKRSTDSGLSWADHGSNLSGIGVTTTTDPTPVRDASRSILFFTNEAKHPGYILADADQTAFDTSRWFGWGGWNSLYGTGGGGWGDEYMMTFVDHTGDQNLVRVAFSNDGVGWSMREPGDMQQSVGTPAVAKVGDNLWVLAYSKRDLASQANTGRLVARVSTNDGWSWGPEVILEDFYRTGDGVSIAADGAGEVRIGFSWSSVGAGTLMRTIRVSVGSDGAITSKGMIYGSDTSRTRPVMTKSGGGVFVQAQREQNRLTSINTRTSSLAGTVWENYRRVVESTPVGAGLAAYKDWTYIFLYSLQ